MASAKVDSAYQFQGGDFAKNAEDNISSQAPNQLQVVRKNRKLYEILAEDGTVQLTVHKKKILVIPVGESVWEVQDAQDKNGTPLVMKRKAWHKLVTFETPTGNLITSMSRKWCCLDSVFTWESSTYRWELVWFSTPVRLNLVEVSSGRKVAVLQGNWCLPFMRKKGQWNYKDRITLYEGADDPTWVRIVVGSGMQEADRHRGRRCAASSAGGG